MMDLSATDEQLEFTMEHVIFASGVNGYAHSNPNDDNGNMFPLLDISTAFQLNVDIDLPLAMQCVTIDHSDYLGRIGMAVSIPEQFILATRFLLLKRRFPRHEPGQAAVPLASHSTLAVRSAAKVDAGDIAAVLALII